MPNIVDVTKPIYAFIDSQNLNLGVKEQGWELDFARFRKYLKDKYKIQEAFLSIGYIPNKKSLYQKLKTAGYRIVFKPVVLYRNTQNIETVKGNVDAELLLHRMIEFPNYSQAIIVTGDGDFACLVNYLLKQTKLRRVLIPNKKRYSSLLLPYANYISFVSDLKFKVAKKIGALVTAQNPEPSLHDDKVIVV